jgi:hydrophobic/amphiphilic exporter-1 (mainly G- bacteria), HAE1 family
MSQPEKLDGIAISDTSIRQPVFITMLMLLTVVIGALAYSSLPVNLLPDIDIPTVAVVVTYPGAGSESMADQVAKPLEDQLQTLNGLDHITSVNREGVTQLIVAFDTSISVDRGLQDVRDKVNAVMPSLPRDVLDPVFFKFDPNQSPIITMAVSSKSGRSPLELRTLIDDEIVPRLQQAQGVGAITVNGGQERQINVQMDLNKLKAWRILPAQITQAIQGANANQGLGTITADNRDINLRAPSMLQTPQDIARIQIGSTPYRIGDVATIEDGVADVDGYSRLDGRDSISLSIQRQSGTNTVAVAENVKAQIKTIFDANPDLTYFIPSDQSVEIQESTDAAIEELLIAAVAAMLVVLVFFRDIRNTIVTVAGLPVIMIGTFAAISLFGVTINLVSLLALSVSVGLVIDDAIVVRENIFRQVERGASPRVAASRGTAQVALSVLAMSLTIIAVFLPVTFTSGVTGIIFKSFGITVACAMAISLVEAFTLAPMLSAYFFKQKEGAEHPAETTVMSEQEDVLDEATEKLGLIARFYEGILMWSLRRRWIVVVVALAVFVLSGWAATGLKFNFFPQTDSSEFAMSFELPPGSTLEETDALARRTEEILLKDPSVEAVQSTVGGSGTAETTQFYVKLHEGEPTVATEERLRPQLGFLPTLIFGKPGFGGATTDINSRDIQISVQTTRPLAELQPVLQQLQSSTQSLPYLTDIDTTFKPGKPELQFHLDPAKIGNLGYTNDQIASSVRALINGDRATTFRKDGKDTDVVVRLKPGDRVGVESIRSLTIPTQNGSVPLSTLGTIELTGGPTSIRRYDRQNQVLIGANVQGRNISEVQQELDAGIKQLNLPPDVTVSFVGFAQSQNEGFTTLFIAMGLSILFVYMVLASQFGSFLQPLVIMLAMPFSFIGAFLALRLTNIELSIFGMIGLIMLLGLVVKNSILMVDFTNRLIRAGMDKNIALGRAGAIRLRPILMTTIALVVGSLPSAIGLGEGAEIRRALSVVVIGGLITSMFLTLLVVPTAYSLLESATRRVSNLFRRRSRQPAAATAGATTFGNGAEHSSEATLRSPAAPSAADATLNQGNGHDTSSGAETVSTRNDSQES